MIARATTTEICTLSLHDALPICTLGVGRSGIDYEFLGAVAPEAEGVGLRVLGSPEALGDVLDRSEEHTSELQSHVKLVCRLLLEKKKFGRWSLWRWPG